MNRLLISFLLLCCFVKAQEFKAVKGNLSLIIENDTLYFSDESIRAAQFSWPDGSFNMFLNLDDHLRFRRKRIIKKIKTRPYTWVTIGEKIYRFDNESKQDSIR